MRTAALLLVFLGCSAGVDGRASTVQEDDGGTPDAGAVPDAGSAADYFREHVEPVLRERGCVECHVGSAHDWTGPDLHAAVLAYRPRMIDPLKPEASTMLGKGFYGQHPDGGEYAAALAWIAME